MHSFVVSTRLHLSSTHFSIPPSTSFLSVADASKLFGRKDERLPFLRLELRSSAATRGSRSNFPTAKQGKQTKTTNRHWQSLCVEALCKRTKAPHEIVASTASTSPSITLLVFHLQIPKRTFIPRGFPSETDPSSVVSRLPCCYTPSHPNNSRARVRTSQTE